MSKPTLRPPGYFIALGAIARGPMAKNGIRIEGWARIRSRATSVFDAAPRHGAGWPQLAALSAAARGPACDRPRLQPSPTRHDAGRDGAVRRHHHTAQHRQLARQGNRPHRGHGHRTAVQAGATVVEGPTSSRSPHHPPLRMHGKQRHPHLRRPPRRHVLFRWRVQPGGRAVRIEDPKCVAKTFRTISKPCSPCVEPQAIPVVCVDGPTASGKGTLAAAVAQNWATTC